MVVTQSVQCPALLQYKCLLRWQLNFQAYIALRYTYSLYQTVV